MRRRRRSAPATARRRPGRTSDMPGPRSGRSTPGVTSRGLATSSPRSTEAGRGSARFVPPRLESPVPVGGRRARRWPGDRRKGWPVDRPGPRSEVTVRFRPTLDARATPAQAGSIPAPAVGRPQRATTTPTSGRSPSAGRTAAKKRSRDSEEARSSIDDLRPEAPGLEAGSARVVCGPDVRSPGPSRAAGSSPRIPSVEAGSRAAFEDCLLNAHLEEDPYHDRPARGPGHRRRESSLCGFRQFLPGRGRVPSRVGS
jgi:hypothetical protein